MTSWKLTIFLPRPTQLVETDCNSPTAYVFSYAIGSRKLSANEQFFVGAQTVVSLLRTAARAVCIRRLFYNLLTPAQIKPKSSESRRKSFFNRGGCVSCLRACLGARLLLVIQYPKLSEGALQWCNQIWQSLEEGAGKWCSECAHVHHFNPYMPK